MKRFGQIIREARQAKGLKVYELAERISVNPVYITQIEKHNKLPSPAVIRSIVYILGDNNISHAYILEKKYKLEQSVKKSLHDTTLDVKLELTEEDMKRFTELKKHDKTLTLKKVYIKGLKTIKDFEEH